MKTLFTTEEPMKVLTNPDSDGDQRIIAMHNLKEPLANGGTQAEQDSILKILSDTAISDPQGLCRIAAVEALGRFKDPRVPPVLLQAYQNAPLNTLGMTGLIVQAAYTPATPGAQFAAYFTLDVLATLQEQTLESLGQTRSEEGKKLIIEMALKSHRRPEVKTELELASGYDAEFYRFDIRLAAIRALGNYKNDQAAISTLIQVLRTERDTAVQNRCMESLRAISGQDLGHSPQPWIDAYEKTNPAAAVPATSTNGPPVAAIPANAPVATIPNAQAKK